MNIGIIGSGRVGGHLGVLWAHKQHEVHFGLRNPQDSKGGVLLKEGGEHARTGTHEEAAARSDVLLLALPWEALMEVLPTLGDLNGKVVIDATNRLGKPGNAPAAGQDLQRLLPRARVVKAFNTIGAEHYAHPNFAGEQATMLIAGDDPAAKNVVAGLARDLGFEPIDAGGIVQAGALEALAFAWVQLSRTLGRDFAFRVLTPTLPQTTSPAGGSR